MAQQNGTVNFSGTSEERTYHIHISIPESSDPKDYIITVTRGIVVRDSQGKIAHKTMEESVAPALGGKEFKANRQCTAADALAKDPAFMSKIEAIIDSIIVDQKAKEKLKNKD